MRRGGVSSVQEEVRRDVPGHPSSRENAMWTARNKKKGQDDESRQELIEKAKKEVRGSKPLFHEWVWDSQNSCFRI